MRACGCLSRPHAALWRVTASVVEMLCCPCIWESPLGLLGLTAAASATPPPHTHTHSVAIPVKRVKQGAHAVDAAGGGAEFEWNPDDLHSDRPQRPLPHGLLRLRLPRPLNSNFAPFGVQRRRAGAPAAVWESAAALPCWPAVRRCTPAAAGRSRTVPGRRNAPCSRAHCCRAQRAACGVRAAL